MDATPILSFIAAKQPQALLEGENMPIITIEYCAV